jgi:hypothetical protein
MTALRTSGWAWYSVPLLLLSVDGPATTSIPLPKKARKKLPVIFFNGFF